jgi:hypothetical protein
MAESIRSKANRYARGDFTNRELKILLGGMLADQAIDIATFGRLSKLKGKAFVKVVLPIVRKVGLATARAVPSATARLAGSAIGATRFVVMRHPYIAAAVVTYEVVKNREQIKQLLSEGWEMVQDVNEERRRFEAERQDKTFDFPFVGPVRPLVRRARKKSAYNRAVSAGMKALKRSTKMGARGKFTNSKRAFALVSKTASRLRRGIKVTTKGATGIVARSMRSILRRKK